LGRDAGETETNEQVLSLVDDDVSGVVVAHGHLT